MWTIRTLSCWNVECVFRSSTTLNLLMKVDPDDLLDAAQVAELLGLAHRQAVDTYRRRYKDFPEPLVRRASGKCVLWLKEDIEQWDRRRQKRRASGSG